tara:strand:+ start:822 stop:1034 length:213 start_codon:yes stop_codon:yes gene_type:complete
VVPRESFGLPSVPKGARQMSNKIEELNAELTAARAASWNKAAARAWDRVEAWDRIERIKANFYAELEQDE